MAWRLRRPYEPSGRLGRSVDLADVGFSLVGVNGDGEQGDVGGPVEDQADRLGFRVAASQSEDPGTVGLGSACSEVTRLRLNRP